MVSLNFQHEIPQFGVDNCANPTPHISREIAIFKVISD